MIRWVVAFLLVANLAFYLWTLQQSRSVPAGAALPPPELGNLRLLTEEPGKPGGPGGPAVAETAATGSEPVPDAVTDGSGDRDAAPATDAPASVATVAGTAPAETPAVPPIELPLASPPAAPGSVDSATVTEQVPVDNVEADDTGPFEPGLAAIPVGPAVSAAQPPAPAGPATPVDAPVPVFGDADAGSNGEPAPAVAQDSAPGTGEADATEPLAPTEAVGSSAEAAALPPALAAIAAQLSDTAPPEPQCARIGPFDQQAVAGARAGLPAGVQVLAETAEDGAVISGYYVLIPPLPNRAAGNDMLQRLAAAGVSDTWLFRRGDLNNAISLGLFSRETSARRHADNMTAKGFEVEVRPRTRSALQHWLLVQRIGGTDALRGMPLPDGASSTDVDCPAR